MRLWQWMLLAVASVAITSGFIVVNTAFAQQVRIEQQIKPIECTYTTTQTGTTTTTTSDNCNDLPVPTVTTLSVNGGRPLIRGAYDASRTALFSVWLYGQWHTLGVDSHLTTDADTWILDLSEMTQPLPSGTYNVVLWVEANDGLVIQDSHAATFSLVQTKPPVVAPGVPKSPGSLETPGASDVQTTILGIDETGPPFVPSLSPLSPVAVTSVGAKDTSGAQPFHPLFWLVVLVVGALVVGSIVKNRRRDS